MPSVASVISYVILFLGICVFVVVAMALWNIFTKAYNSKPALIVVVALLITFLIFSFLTLSSSNRVLATLRSEETNLNLPAIPTNSGSSEDLF